MLKQANLECMSEQASALPPVPTSLPPKLGLVPKALSSPIPARPVPNNAPNSLPVVVPQEKDGHMITGVDVTGDGKFFAFDARQIDLTQESTAWSFQCDGLQPLLKSFSRGKFAKLQTLFLVIAR